MLGICGKEQIKMHTGTHTHTEPHRETRAAGPASAAGGRGDGIDGKHSQMRRRIT